MALSKQRLGIFIERVDRRNTELEYGIEGVRGVSNTKEIQQTKADVSDRSFSKFQIVQPGEFVFNRRTTRMGEKLGMGYNNIGETFIVTEDYVVFRVIDEKILLPDYLNIFFRRPEFDRYARWDSWGSATEFFNWEEMCDVPIFIPPLPIQQKYVDVYNAMLANQRAYERGLEDLKLTFDSLIDQIKHSSPKIPVGELLHEIDNRNTDGKVTDASGINISKQFMPSIADTNGVDLKKYKLVRKNQFAFSGMQTGRDRCIRMALYKEDKPIIISPAYTVFQVIDESVLPEYIMIWFSRGESDRRGWFLSDSSIRSNLDLDRFYGIELPMPTVEMQNSIVKLYFAYTARRKINEKLKALIRDICPILIRGSLENGG